MEWPTCYFHASLQCRNHNSVMSPLYFGLCNFINFGQGSYNIDLFNPMCNLTGVIYITTMDLLPFNFEPFDRPIFALYQINKPSYKLIISIKLMLYSSVTNVWNQTRPELGNVLIQHHGCKINRNVQFLIQRCYENHSAILLHRCRQRKERFHYTIS